MQIITKATANTLIFTLTEKCTLTSPVFLFELVNQVDLTPIYFICANTSSYTSRYDKFVVTEASSGTNYYTGTITCTNVGEYIYRIWEQSSTTNLNPQLATTLLETGFIKVEGSANTFNVYQPPVQTSVIYGATQ